MQIEIDEKKLINDCIVEGIANSEEFKKQVEEILEDDECQQIIKDKIKDGIKEYLETDDGKETILNLIKNYVEEYEINYDDDINREFSEIMIGIMKNIFDIRKIKKLKEDK